MRVFVAAVEAGGFSQAARRLYISHSTVSRNVSALETELGATLIERGSHNFALTAVGQGLYEDALTILRYADAAATRVRAGDPGG